MDPEADWANSILGSDSCAHSGLSRSLKAEVDAYLVDNAALSYSSMMTFWQVSYLSFFLRMFAYVSQENRLRYPTIFMLAMDVLAIQGSAVPCERVFSSGKETMSACRSRIKYDLMEALQMLKFSLKHGQELNFTEGSGRLAELQELEEQDFIDSLVPEDLMAFRQSLVSQEDNDLD